MQSEIVGVAVGLLTTFLAVAIASSAVVETVSSLLAKRSADLKAALRTICADSEPVMAMLNPRPAVGGEHGAAAAAKGHRASYLSARSFADRVVDGLADVAKVGQQAPDVISQLPASPLTRKLNSLYCESSGDLVRIKSGLERWFDDVMGHVQTSYKRWSQWALLVVGLALAAIFNVSAVRIVDTLWSDAPLRSAVVDSAAEIAGGPCPGGEATCTAQDKLAVALSDVGGLPVGWGSGWDAQSGALWTIAGWLPVAVAAKAGAPFWFDLLGRVAGLRSRGIPPKASDDPGSHTTAALAGISLGTIDDFLAQALQLRTHGVAPTTGSGSSAPGSDSSQDTTGG